MAKQSPAVYLLFFLLLTAVLLAPCDAAVAGQSPRNVLLLTSYHQGDHWNDSVVQGVREALGPIESVSLSIENLDMRRYTDQDHTRKTAEYIRAKYQSKPQDLILVSDDPALNFLLTLRDDLFPSTPVVFCGINNFTAKRIQGQSNITGVNEALSLEATLDLVLKLFPKTTRIMAVVSDTEANGRTNLEQYRAAAARMKGRVQFDELLNMTDKTAPDILSRLPKDSLVLRLINLLNLEGGYVSLQDSIRMISTHAPVPVFTPWSFDLGDGALGGYVSSGRDQGRVAGNLAIRILGGQEAEQIPVVMESPNVPMFDYKVLERFGIKESDLPKGSVILNHQLSLWEQYWGWCLSFVVIAALQTFLIVTLFTRGKRLRATNVALQDSEHFSRSLLEAIPVPVFYKGIDGRYQGFNQAFLHFYGKNKAELIGKSVFDLTPLDTAKVYHANDMELFEKSGIQIYPSEVKTAQGDLRDVIFHKASLTDEYGVVTGLIGAILDVTDLKRMERQNQVLANIINRSQDFIGVADMKQMAFFVNPAGQALVGLDGDEAVAKTTIEEHFLTEDLPFFQNTILPAVMKEGRWAGEFRFRHFETGKPVPVLIDLFLVEDPKTGAATNFATITRDITEHKQAEIALRQSEAKFRLLVNTAPFGIQLTDVEGKIIYSNLAHHRIQGYGPNELIGMHIWDLMANDSHRAEAREYYQTIICKKPEPTVYFNRDRTKDGREIDVRVIWDYVHNDQGQVDGIISILEDITELKRSEEEKKTLTAQLQQAQKLEAIGTLAGGIAHDFNNILGAIVGYSEIIRDDLPPGSPSSHDINQVLIASHRAKDLVKQILAFSRQVEDQKIPVQPAVIVKEAITLLRSSLPTTITINQDIDPVAGMVLADPTQIHQIVMNLSTNAFHAMEVKGGMLTISLQKKILCGDDLATTPDLQPGTFVQLLIKDTGEGILPEIRERIFDPFFTTKEVGKGTGLGLSMVYSIVKSCNGSIACDSRVDEGTEFRILLPVLECNAEEEDQSTTLTPHGKEHILLIDDEEMLAEMGQTMLERLGYHVTTRINSLDALTTFQNQPDAFDLLITDQTMPGMTGVDLARRVLQIRPEMPIILCTGYSGLISEDKAKVLGIRGYAFKPLSKKDIGELIRKVLDGRDS